MFDVNKVAALELYSFLIYIECREDPGKENSGPSLKPALQEHRV